MSTVDVEITIQRRGRLNAPGGARATADLTPRIPRITRLMALAVKFQDMVHRGEVRDYADLARLGYVTRARLTQIMNLLLLAPDIQEHLLSLPSSVPVRERHLRAIVAIVDWLEQRRLFQSFADPT
jgi:hypothetical protein